jgi:hypothetical protein
MRNEAKGGEWRHPWKSREEPHYIAMANFEVCGHDGWGEKIKFLLDI